MQSRVIATGEPLLANDVVERVKGGGTFYNVERDGSVRKIPDQGPPGTQAAMMIPIKHEGRVVGVVQLMSDDDAYTVEQLELAEGLVTLMGAAVRNARLHKDAQAETAARVRAEAVAAEREQAAGVLEAVGEGIFLVDGDGIVRLWNRAAILATGLHAEDVRDRPIADALPGWDAIAGQIPVCGERCLRRVGDLAARARRHRAVALVRGGPKRRGDRVRVPRPDDRAGARGGEERVHRHRLARAADAHGRHLRRGADAA